MDTRVVPNGWIFAVLRVWRKYPRPVTIIRGFGGLGKSPHPQAIFEFPRISREIYPAIWGVLRPHMKVLRGPLSG